jgi:tetratricopeptide (TPR) repeat protein
MNHSAVLTATLLGAVTLVACGGTTAEEHIARGDAFAKQRKYAEAVVEYRRALQENAGLGTAHFKLGQSYEQLQAYGHAAQAYMEAADLLPSSLDVQLTGASMFLLNRRFEEARLSAERALQIDDRNIRAHILHAHALGGLKRTGQALAAIQKAIGLDPTRGDTYSEFGMFQLSTGSFEQAEMNLKKAADAHPPSSHAQLTLASVYWAQGRLADAETYLTRAAAIDPADARVSRALATFYLGTERTDEAEQHLTRVAEQTRTISASLALADYYIAMTRMPDALRVLEPMAAQPGTEGFDHARSRIAAVHYRQGRKDEAHRLIDDTLAKAPRSARAMLTKANFLLVEQRLDAALTQLKAAVAADQRSIPARFALATFYASQHNEALASVEYNEILRIDPESIPAQMELARLNLAAGRADAAAQLAQQAADARPNLDSALLLARTLAGKGEISRAETILRPYIADTSRADVLTLAGGIYVGIGESDRGRALLEKAARVDPQDPEPIESLVTLDLRAGNIAGARSLVDQRLARNPRDSRLLVLSARTHGAAGDLNRMISLLRSAIEADDTNTTAYALLGQVYASQGRLPDALREFERVIARDPRSVSAQTMAAFLIEAMGRTDEAVTRYKRVLELDPRAPVAANNLAWLYVEGDRDLDVALQLAQVAKERLPEAAAVNDTLAWIYYRKDLPDMALSPLKLAVEREPDNAMYHFHLGLVYLKTGDVETARESLARALKIDPNFRGAAQARQALALLQ